MKKKFGFLMWMLSAAVTAAVFSLWIMINPIQHVDTVLSGVLYSIAYFASFLLCGFGAVRLAIWIGRKKYQVNTAGMGKRLVAVLVMVAMLGGIGQLLYSIEKQKYTKEIIIDDTLKGLHLAVLMDVSGSMKEEREGCVEAVCELIEGMDEANSMQFIAFSGTVTDRGESAFLPLTAANKITLQDMVRSINMVGGTNFDEPLDKAIATLQDNMDPDYSSLIIMVTDGDAPIDSRIANVLTDPDSGIELFTLRITDGSSSVSADVQAMIDMAAMDFPIVQQADGTVDVTAVQDAFREALNYQRVIEEEHEKLGLGKTLVFSTMDKTLWWRPVIQVVVLALYALLVSVAYYGKPSVISAVLNLALGAVSGLLLATGVYMGAYALFIVCVSAVAILEVEEVHQNV